MTTVTILKIEWNRRGDCGREFHVHKSLESAQIEVTWCLHQDLQYGDFGESEGLPDDFDLFEANNNSIPIPTTYVRLANSDEDYIEYIIYEQTVVDYAKHFTNGVSKSGLEESNECCQENLG